MHFIVSDQTKLLGDGEEEAKYLSDGKSIDINKKENLQDMDDQMFMDSPVTSDKESEVNEVINYFVI